MAVRRVSQWCEQAGPIILELRDAELEPSRGRTVPEAAKKIGVTEQTYSL